MQTDAGEELRGIRKLLFELWKILAQSQCRLWRWFAETVSLSHCINQPKGISVNTIRAKATFYSKYTANVATIRLKMFSEIVCHILGFATVQKHPYVWKSFPFSS